MGESTYLNDMATLTFNSPEVAIKQLFHQDGEIMGSKLYIHNKLRNNDLYIHVFTTGAFTLSTLWILFLVYFFIACWTHGAGISAGIFLPCLLIGATYGRIVGMLFE